MRLSLDSNPLFTNLTTICGGAVVGATILVAFNNPGATLLGSTAGSVAGSMAGQAYSLRKRDDLGNDIEHTVAFPSTFSTPTPRPTTPIVRQPIEANHAVAEQIKEQRPSLSKSVATDIPPALFNLLADRNVQVHHSHAATEADLVFDRLARKLGENYVEEQGGHVLRSFMGRLRWAITHNRTGTKFQLRNANQNQTRVLTSIARELGRSSVFSNYHYVKDHKVLNIGLTKQVEAQDFLVGGWFERFIYQEVESLLTQSELPFEVLKNPLIRFPNQDTFEVDLLFFVEGKPLLIECKTGKNPNYLNRHLEKFAAHCKKLAIESDRAFLVVLDLAPTQEQDLANLWPFQSASQTTFIPKLRLALGL